MLGKSLLIGFSEPIDRATALSILSPLPRLPGVYAFLNSPASSQPAPNHASWRYRASAAASGWRSPRSSSRPCAAV